MVLKFCSIPRWYSWKTMFKRKPLMTFNIQWNASSLLVNNIDVYWHPYAGASWRGCKMHISQIPGSEPLHHKGLNSLRFWSLLHSALHQQMPYLCSQKQRHVPVLCTMRSKYLSEMYKKAAYLLFSTFRIDLVWSMEVWCLILWVVFFHKHWLAPLLVIKVSLKLCP